MKDKTAHPTENQTSHTIKNKINVYINNLTQPVFNRTGINFAVLAGFTSHPLNSIATY